MSRRSCFQWHVWWSSDPSGTVIYSHMQVLDFSHWKREGVSIEKKCGLVDLVCSTRADPMRECWMNPRHQNARCVVGGNMVWSLWVTGSPHGSGEVESVAEGRGGGGKEWPRNVPAKYWRDWIDRSIRWWVERCTWRTQYSWSTVYTSRIHVLHLMSHPKHLLSFSCCCYYYRV